MPEAPIESLLQESRVFPPPPDFSRNAHVRSLEEYREIHRRAVEDPEGFWAKHARSLRWSKPWKKVLDWSPPFAKWFVNGRINVAENCLDRHLSTPRRDAAAIVWEGEPGDTRTLTYRELHAEVCRFSNALVRMGIRKGDRVAIYMPILPETVVAMLACARIGATHVVVFAGFSVEALRERIRDAEARVVVTVDGTWRGGRAVPLKGLVDEAIAGCPSVERVVVYPRTGHDVGWNEGRDVWWAHVMEGQRDDHEPEPLDSEHPLFILHTSGTTGMPKGVVHSTGGYIVQVALSSRWVFDHRDGDVFWCTADLAWITGHSYVVYGPLANGVTVFLYEGALDTSGKERAWEMIARHRVNVLYTSPTVIRTFMRWGDELPAKHDLSSLRLLGTVGEPIGPDVWMWYREVVGGGYCPIVDTWWETETGAILLAPLPGATPTKPGTVTLPFPGIVPEVVDKRGNPVPRGHGGFLVIKRPWPAMLRTLHNDPERYRQVYYGAIQGVYFTGDGARQDEDGYFWLMGRIDDVLGVAGHRIGAAEVESAIVGHGAVAEAAVVGRPDEDKGQAIVAFVVLMTGIEPTTELALEIGERVARTIGGFARPDVVRFAEALPKTRAGQILRRVLREVAASAATDDDPTTVVDLSGLAGRKD